MPINNSFISSQGIEQRSDVVLEIVSQRPNLNLYISPPDIQGRLVAYYNAIGNYMEFYVVGRGGTKWLRCG
jgi:hypothetical protein